MRKLTKAEKLEVIDEVLRVFEAGGGQFICPEIREALFEQKMISKGEFYSEKTSKTVIEAIPELRKIKPVGIRLDHVWFGDATDTSLRIEKLKELREIIETQTT
jgi:hypothetical protein